MLEQLTQLGPQNNVCMHTDAHKYTHTHTLMHNHYQHQDAPTQAYTHTHTHTHTHTQRHRHTHRQTHTYAHARTHAHTHISSDFTNGIYRSQNHSPSGVSPEICNLLPLLLFDHSNGNVGSLHKFCRALSGDHCMS